MIAKPKQPVRVRIAPSPTGYLHIGTARTALFNWLFAKREGGAFILRIEDTDLERSDQKYEKDILENLKWLGLEWDEGPIADVQNQKPKIKNKNYVGDYGPYRQSERLDTYEKYINQLLDQNLAYYCVCSEEELEAQRQAMMAQGLAPKYNGKCRPKELKTGDIIRFRTPETKVTFNDLIRGETTFDGSLIGDFAIAKNSRTPLYNFAVVVDDYEMKISHVLRGEEHLANTPKQIFIQEALEFYQPAYAHLPLILNPDRSKMSKRFTATAINEYKETGYLPEALINFMALLGWHPAPEPPAGGTVRGRPQEQELFTLTELIQLFDLRRVQKAGAIFNIEKLNWINSQHLKRLGNEELLDKLLPYEPRLSEIEKRETLKIVSLVRDRLKKLSDFRALSDFFFELPEYPAELLIWKTAPKEKIARNLELVLELTPDVKKIMALAEERGRGEVLWPLRAALSGKDASPGPLEIMEALGKAESARRLQIAIKKLHGDQPKQ